MLHGNKTNVIPHLVKFKYRDKAWRGGGGRGWVEPATGFFFSLCSKINSLMSVCVHRFLDGFLGGDSELI